MHNNKNHNYVWVIVSNNVPVEAYEDEFIAQQVANKWNQQSSAHVTYYRVSLVSQTKKSEDMSNYLLI